MIILDDKEIERLERNGKIIKKAKKGQSGKMDDGMGGQENPWDRLPEWLRWILCWPLMLIIPFIVLGFIKYIRTVDAFGWEIKITQAIIVPVVAQWLNISLIFYLIPRFKIFFGFFYTALISLISLIIPVSWIVCLFMEGYVSRWNNIWDLIQSIACLSVIYFYIVQKDEYRRRPAERYKTV